MLNIADGQVGARRVGISDWIWLPRYFAERSSSPAKSNKEAMPVPPKSVGSRMKRDVGVIDRGSE